MRQFLFLFPVDRRDIERHAATIRRHFATRRQIENAALLALMIAAILANIVAAVVIIGGGR